LFRTTAIDKERKGRKKREERKIKLELKFEELSS
jgi:hypothetical protein